MAKHKITVFCTHHFFPRAASAASLRRCRGRRPHLIDPHKSLGFEEVKLIASENYYILATKSTIKLTYVRTTLEKGCDAPERDPSNGKRADNVRRARTRMLDIGQSNEWQYMATFTSALEDPSVDIRRLSKWLNNWNTHHSASIKYMMVFELGEKGRRLHAHALLSDVPEKFIQRYSASQYQGLPANVKLLYSKHKDATGQTQLAFCPWWKYGWSTLVPVDGSPKVVSYMTKYMTKGTISFTTAFAGHSYFASKGLNVPQKKKIPADTVGAVWGRIPENAWCSKYENEPGKPLTMCYVLDKDKIPSDLWSYYTATYNDIQVHTT